MPVTLKINGKEVKADDGMTILAAAQSNDIYIPRLCYHPSLGSSHGLKPEEAIFREDGEFRNDGSSPKDGFPGCRLCLVEIGGRDGLFTSCDTLAEEGMRVNTETEAVRKARKDSLAEILRDHPHACLRCAQQEGCSRSQCSSKVPENERCCPRLGHCELQKVSQYVGLREDLTKYVFKDLPKHESEPLFDRDYNLCISCLRCVRACRDLRGIETLGFIYKNGKALVGPTKSSRYADSDCRFCGACAEVCPTGAITDKDMPKGERPDVLVPCRAGCPARIDTPRYLRLVAEGRHSEATAVIRERVPFPTILGYVCFHPCEDVCRRGSLDQPISICGLKRFAAENEGERPVDKPREPTGKRVAVVGSGPAGLSAAYYLALAGHAVTVFEGEGEFGGMLRQAIPDYRLPPGVLEEELMVLNRLNVAFKTNVKIGKDVTLSNLKNDHQAVYVATGATLSKRIRLDGSDLEGVKWGLDFLRDAKKKRKAGASGRVVVIGGGNVAVDVARTALRLGASEVRLVCLENDEEMPAHDWEVEEAIEEGVIVSTSWGPKKILGEKKVAGIELVKCVAVFDERGNFAPKFEDCTTTTIETDSVILAIGQAADFSYLEGVELVRGAIRTDDKMQTSIPGIFAGGEAARGPSSVIRAIADGAAAASAMDKFLGGNGDIYPRHLEKTRQDPKIGSMKGFAGLCRVNARKRQVEERKRCFDTVELGYKDEDARREASRCLRCDLRLEIESVTLPPERWFELNEGNVAAVPAAEGVYQLLDENKCIIAIKGAMDIQADLKAKLGAKTKAKYFGFETDPMYSKRESELIQRYLQQFGKMPKGDGEGDSLDDLF